MHFDKELDTSGLACPLPVIKTKKSLAELAVGQVLRVTATDPGSVHDMQTLAERPGISLLSATTEGERFVFFLKRT
jgi:tRNA 2-thiouridine synthesizing protein A